MTAAVRSRGAVARRRGLLLVVMALVISALAASATAVALGSRADLSSSRRRVDFTWGALRPALDGRYQKLAAAGAAARAGLTTGRALFDEIDGAVAAWPGTARSSTDRQVDAAARLEGLAARLSATVATTPRLRASTDVAEAMRRLEQTDTTSARAPYNTAVAAYQRARGGFPRRLVAGALGYDDRRTLEVPA
ncbi:MAG: LemA family [Actinomycetota bacterium]|nr:LemA family [Actinomycetota bacterium]MDQ1502845.1 LemA family [Actinomycetota bacterium]